MFAALFVTSTALLVIMLYQIQKLTSKKEEVESLLIQKELFTAEIENLQKENKELGKRLEMNNKSGSSPKISYTQPGFLQVEWDEVMLEAEDEKVVIDSKPIVEAFRGQFIGITQTENPYPAGFPIGFTFHIFSGDLMETYNTIST
ncbi:hypothetical protein [Sporosarcina sp. SAFN-015]|uniref:hypothetical protein n=1 Tax=Sporosarcina sp. SAFN-015 TaxID=3387274 RepID=UPI003F7F9A7A